MMMLIGECNFLNSVLRSRIRPFFGWSQKSRSADAARAVTLFQKLLLVSYHKNS